MDGSEQYDKERAGWHKTFDLQLRKIMKLEAELAEAKKRPEIDVDVNTTSALRQLATHVLTFVKLYDPKVLEGKDENARRLRDIRDRAAAALEHATPLSPPAPPTVAPEKK